ncbi:Hypothetical Protein FCC1311_103582 [Hondaea fermentalgiana]|uniref:Uncharacterized protein n=1 Tax=Hondaea fermentalgiana TaxID=2315210 RepID=A0A2R5H1C3_9STRA|nr:Hypothetical Protein FCC1311_103582 [Hondaea fermentalgiana]|eukprot:GBG34134.1 Hypothetical Protein FCC1311_103582 [Hondaea fermentalgiana]
MSESRHVQAREEDYEGHEDEQMEKHLTMKYNMRELRLFTEFETWVSEFLEEQVPDDSERPVIEAAKMVRLSEEKRAKALQKILQPHIPDEEVLDSFIEEYMDRFNDLPDDVLEILRS